MVDKCVPGFGFDLTDHLNWWPAILVGPRVTCTLSDLPEACHKSANQEEAVSLDKRWQEGEEAICRHANEEALSAAHFVRHPSPKERSNHHPQVNNTACKEKERVTSDFYLP